ncbi:MAG: DEAD/DEAH box helicase family protein [Pseudoxanthomonas sp.]|nr:DEAD/DEAH box helicase family protein [Pseudoxanthomonas sp.]
MTLALKRFQEEMCEGLLARFAEVARRYDELGPGGDEARRDLVRHTDGALMFQAPTGSGKTLIAVELMARMSAAGSPVGERLLWFWFAPFAGVVEQARGTLRRQAPQLAQLDGQNDRRLDALRPGAVFVTTWQSVAAARADSRRARQKSDDGLSIDALIAQARREGYRIACVVDEAHHGFQMAAEARRFFAQVLKPDFALLMTATPNDADAARFAKETGYSFGGPERWASLSRADGVDAGLLKRGVKLVRFIARDAGDAALIDFERTALDECVAMHRRIKGLLDAAGIGVTPLMLVQVPDDPSLRVAKGEPSQIERVRQRLVAEWGFPEGAVRTHSAREPDPDIIALANDPGVEVLVFKMAVALGFDAPRAFTLAALRGSRDTDFGVQVIGRLMRVAAPLHGRTGLSRELDFGYVFLANYAAQEGLLNAGELINQMQTQAPDLGTQTVITVIAGESQVQIARTGESLQLLPLPDTVSASGASTDGGSPHAPDVPASPIGPALPLFADSFLPAVGAGAPAESPPSLSDQLGADARRRHTLKRAEAVPAELVSEHLPPPQGRLEERIVQHVRFDAGVISAHQAEWATVRRQTVEVFGQDAVREPTEADRNLLATLRPEAIASRVQRQLDLFVEVNQGTLLQLLAERFRQALLDHNIRPPADEEELDRRLDLVLVRHPGLLREAFRHARMSDLGHRHVRIPAIQAVDSRGPEARRNSFGQWPEDLNRDERDFAALLDASAEINWWHRNPSQREEESVRLYAWDDGAAFNPDFVVSVRGRETSEGIVLVEVKGPQLWRQPQEARKIAGSQGSPYGEVIAVGRTPGGRFQWLKPNGTGDQARLEPIADFTIAQLRLAGT